MPVTPPENRESARGSDSRKGHPVEKVSGHGGVEAVGGKTGIRFPIHNHPDKSQVRGKLSQ